MWRRLQEIIAIAAIEEPAVIVNVFRKHRALDRRTSSHIKGRPPFLYGYQWWLGRSSIERREVRWAAGFGYGGQRLIVVPALDLVVVVTAGLYQNPLQRGVHRRILDEHVLPAVRQQPQ